MSSHVTRGYFQGSGKDCSGAEDGSYDMKLAIMQPYFFPYIGYFQLMAAVDRWVTHDDVNFMRQSWINRNQILVSCKAFMFSLPLEHSSSFRAIHETCLASDGGRSRQKLFKTIEQSYRKAPHFHQVYDLIKGVFARSVENMGQLAYDSVCAVARYLDLSVEIVPTSRHYENGHLKGEERVLDICRREAATEYFNLPGGKALYNRKTFAEAGVTLNFIQPVQLPYRQYDCAFVPWLSIIDVMMFNGPDTVRSMLNQYEVA